MGKYSHALLDSPYNGHEVYENWDTDYRLYFTNNGWLVAAELGDTYGVLFQQDPVSCPFFAPTGWLYAYQGSWFEDPTLTVTCTS